MGEIMFAQSFDLPSPAMELFRGEVERSTVATWLLALLCYIAIW